MKKSTVKYIREVYENQWQHAMALKKPSGRQTAAYKEQMAYYDGMMEMLSIIATEAYTVSGKSVNNFLDEQMD